MRSERSWRAPLAWAASLRPVGTASGCAGVAGRAGGLAEVAAGDGEHTAGDVGGFVGGQEGDRARPARRAFRSVSSGTSRWSGPRSAGTRPSPCSLSGWGPRATWRGGASVPPGRCGHHADPVRGGFQGQGSGDGLHTALGGRVGDPVDAAGGNGGDVDDNAALPADHVRQDGPAGPEGGEEGPLDFLADLVRS